MNAFFYTNNIYQYRVALNISEELWLKYRDKQLTKRIYVYIYIYI